MNQHRAARVRRICNPHLNTRLVATVVLGLRCQFDGAAQVLHHVLCDVEHYQVLALNQFGWI